MSRFASHLLLGLVCLMALVPQSLCPCAVAARAGVRERPGASGEQDAPRPACCPRCAARQAAHAAAAGTSAPAAPGRTPICPCCALNGQGKYLLTLGDAVRPAPLDVVGLVWALPAPSLFAPTFVERPGREAPVRPSASPAPLSERLTSVVLLI